MKQLDDDALDSLVTVARANQHIDGDTLEAVVDELRAHRIQTSAEQRLRNNQAALMQLVRSEALAGGQLDQALREICETAAEIARVSHVSVWRCSEDGQRLTRVAHVGPEPGAQGPDPTLERAEFPAYFEAVFDQAILAVHDARVDPRTAKLWDEVLGPRGVASRLDATIRLGGRVLGVVSCEAVEQARSWSTNDGQFVGSLADFAALAMQSHWRLQAEERLRESVALAEQRLETIDRQRLAIADLSAPIIDVWDGVLAIPLVGVIDAQRSIDLTQRLLERIASSGAREVIIDLTGIDVVDTMTANHLLSMLRAVRLLGSDCVVSGVSPQVAQTVVQLDIDLHELRMARSLKQALELCLRRSKG